MRLRLTFVTCTAFVLCASDAFLAAPQPEKDGPYQVAQRPMPKGEDLEVLLPRTVGTFTRKPLPAGTKPPVNEDLNVDYVSGTDAVNVGFSIPGSIADAHEAIRMARQDGIDTLRKTAKANSPAALDAFMRAFPF
jgi:hypothetical protein